MTIAKITSSEQQKGSVIRTIVYNGAVKIHRDFSIIFGAQGNDFERSSKCKRSDEHRLGRVGESAVCILFRLDELGILIYYYDMLC